MSDRIHHGFGQVERQKEEEQSFRAEIHSLQERLQARRQSVDATLTARVAEKDRQMQEATALNMALSIVRSFNIHIYIYHKNIHSLYICHMYIIAYIIFS